MRAAIIGYGQMGKIIKEELGPECVCVIAPQSPDLYSSIYEYAGFEKSKITSILPSYS